MKTFSMSEAIAEPFRIAFGKPFSTMAWGGLMLLPAAIVMAAMIPLYADMMASGMFDPDAMNAAGPPDPWNGDFAAMMQLQLMSWLSNIVQLFALLLVTTAIARAVFAGRRGDGAAFLRLSKDELHVAVVGIAIFIGAMLVMVVLLLAGIGISFGLAATADRTWGVLAGVGLCLVVVVGLLLLWGRLALMAPAAVRHGTFGFEEGWKLGRGKTWKLFGLLLLLIVITLAVSVAFMIVAAIVIIAVAGGVGAFTDPDSIEAWFGRQMKNPWPLVAAAVALLIPFAWVQGFSQLLFTAPYARVVKDLTPPAPAVEPAPEPAPEPISADATPPSE